jgi:hypothetical protein
MSTRTLSEFDYVKTNKSAKAAKDEDRLSGINVGASGSAAKILAQVAAKVCLFFPRTISCISSSFVLISPEHTFDAGRVNVAAQEGRHRCHKTDRYLDAL